MNFMQFAIEEALKTTKDVPVGAVIVKDGKIIAQTHNTREIDNDITSHAEILALRKAEKVLNNWRLDNCDIYITLEPCPMCGWAILQSRIKNVYFGSYDTNYGSFSSKINLRKLSNFSTNIYGGIMEEECDGILKDFFKKLRNT
ncbi:nucleoside deaminase [bacterium]|nr:nucleoside deaminase [bacterium]